MDTNKIFIDIAQRAREFAEMCERMANETKQKEDPEAWREECRKKQAAGVRFEKIGQGGLVWLPYVGGFENGIKEDYREVPQEVQKEGDIRIPDAMNWATIKDMFKQGLKLEVNANFNGVWRKLTEDPKWSGFSKGQLRIPTQPIPAGMSVEAVESMWRQGLMLEFDGNFGWDLAADGFDWNGIYRGAQLLARLRIPAQPIPEKLLEDPQEVFASECQKAALEHLAKTYSADKGTAQLNPTIPPHAAELDDADEIRKWADRYYSLWCFVENSLPRDESSDTFDIFRGYARQVNDEIYGVTDKAKEPHAAERALYWAQRVAGTNEVWQVVHNSQLNVASWMDIVDKEPQWLDGYLYRAKPMKLTAKIVPNIKVPPGTQEWPDKEWILDWTDRCGHTIIGNIEEREIEA